jgi:hypothetical protein
MGASTALIDEGQRLGLGFRQRERTVASGITAGMEHPRVYAIGQ